MDWTSFAIGFVLGMLLMVVLSALISWWLVKPQRPEWPSGQGAYDELEAALERCQERVRARGCWN